MLYGYTLKFIYSYSSVYYCIITVQNLMMMMHDVIFAVPGFYILEYQLAMI